MGQGSEVHSGITETIGDTDDRATIVVENIRSWTGSPGWIGSQKRGAVHVSLDGHKAGIAFPEQRLLLSCAPGGHKVRIRQWWYRSAQLNVDLGPREVLELVADEPKGGAWTRLAVLVFRPWRSISLDRRDGATE